MIIPHSLSISTLDLVISTIQSDRDVFKNGCACACAWYREEEEEEEERKINGFGFGVLIVVFDSSILSVSLGWDINN